MADKACEEACVKAYDGLVATCAKNYQIALAEAGDDEAKRKEAKERFQRCMKLSHEVRDDCTACC